MLLVHGGGWRSGDRSQLKGYGILLGLAIFFGAATLFLALRNLGSLFAAARFLRQAEAVFLSLAWARLTTKDVTS